MTIVLRVDPRRFAGGENIGTTVGVVMAAVVIVGFTALTARKLRTMDVP
ncbi:MAG: hypothetical protein H0U64_11100 [Gemmatimonadaceae bacterium]|nr:hypothetical protein [Gemmatimonadaceae bacterium]